MCVYVYVYVCVCVSGVGKLILYIRIRTLLYCPEGFRKRYVDVFRTGARACVYNIMLYTRR